MEVIEYHRSRSFFDLDERLLRIQNSNLFISETIGSSETKVHTKNYGRMGMHIYTNELSYMIKMAAMPIYCKTV